MKKRIFSILTALCLCLTLLPGAARAEDGDAAPAEQQEVIPEANPAQTEGEPVALNGEDETWTEIDQTYINKNRDDQNYITLDNGNYQFIEDIQLKDYWSLLITGTVTLDLNGCKLEAVGYVPSFIYVAANAALTLVDNSTAKTGVIRYSDTVSDRYQTDGVYLYENSSFIMESGTIECVPYGVTNASNNIFTMNGGVIQNCEVGVANSGTMYANGGTVKDCTDYAMINSGTVQVGSGKTGTVFKGNVTSILWPIENDIEVKGFGTEAHPYELTTAAELKAFRDFVNSGNTGACAVLTKDIDLEGEAWTPIGYASEYDETKAYSGTFDGNGHTISGLNANAVVNGLFGYTNNAAIKNLTVAGSVGGGSCSTAGGGIIGYAVGGAIENCGNLCEVKVRGSYPGGGIVGFASNLTIIGCYNAGKVLKDDGSCGAGIVGKGENVNIYDCYNVGEIDGYTGKRGGIVGEASGPVFAYNCYNAGNVIEAGGTGDANKTVRGIVGGGDGPVQIWNCYYLEGTRADAEAIAKSAEEFSNGTVLKLLKAGTHNGINPWDSGSKEWNGMVLPGFTWQTNNHTHTWGEWISNGNGTHTRTCTTCKAVETINCSGGTATCKDKAVCSVCAQPYGELNPNYHGANLKHVEAKAATTSEAGNIEYWHCDACNKYFSDANAQKEITRADTVIPKRRPSGNSASYPITVPDKTDNGSVTVSPKSASAGSTVTVTVTPDKGYALETLTVTDKNGNALDLTDRGGGKYAFTMPSGPVTVAATFMDDNTMLNFFVDVPAGAYYYDAVLWAAEGGIVTGTDAVHFSPDASCTRAQLVTFLWRAAGKPVVNYAMNFTDVDSGAYYAEAIRWAASEKIVDGTTAETFAPNAVVTRAQVVAMLYRFAKAQGMDTTQGGMAIREFDDFNAVPAYALEAMDWAVNAGVLKGDNNRLLPQDNCTRAQIVTMLCRALGEK